MVLPILGEHVGKRLLREHKSEMPAIVSVCKGIAPAFNFLRGMRGDVSCRKRVGKGAFDHLRGVAAAAEAERYLAAINRTGHRDHCEISLSYREFPKRISCR